ncbi:MAG: hypothetical protein GY765_06020 [bacterium]|nr:hypothetical protein [bacterium]
MKKTNLKKKLELNKITITGLNDIHKAGIVGGGSGLYTCLPCMPPLPETMDMKGICGFPITGNDRTVGGGATCTAC